MTKGSTVEETTVDELEEEGKRAAKEWPGPILVLAGPGTGKTECLAMRVKWLIKEKSVDPEHITVITFTNEAAKNMRERISSNKERPHVYIEASRQPSRITTMHSLGVSVLKECLEKVGLREGFGVVEDDDVRRVLFEDAAQLAGLPRKRGEKILTAKQEGAVSSIPIEERGALEWYDKILRSGNKIDFDDQIILACQVLQEDADLLKQFQAACVHLLVDEYQDINSHQDQLIRLLSGASREGLFVVGDDDQSIYRFRGADRKYMAEFETVYAPSGRTVKLSVCRRCPQNVMNAADAVVQRFNKGRLEKPPRRFLSSESGHVVVHKAPGQTQEAHKIASIAANVPVGSSTLVLVPSALFAGPIKAALESKNLSYEAKTNVKFAGLRAADVLATWLAAQNDSFALRLLLSHMCEVKSLGVPSGRSRKPKKLKERESRIGRIAALWSDVIGNERPLHVALQRACVETEKKSPDKRAAEDNLLLALEERLRRLVSYEEKSTKDFLSEVSDLLEPWAKPAAFLDEVQSVLAEARGRRGGKNRGTIRLMTMRFAKGLEADYVHVVGLDEGVFPSGKASPEEIEENCRQLYVAMSRAKAELHLYHARTRDASITYTPQSYQMKPSPFLSAIPHSVCETDCTWPVKARKAKAVPRRNKRK